MNFLGINDPKITHLAQSLTKTGFNVITPEIPEVKGCLINPDTLKSISDFLDIFKENISYQNVGLFLISLSGGMSLIPVSKYRKLFKSVITIGGHSDFEKTISYIIKNFEIDNYGTYILLYNYIDLIIKNQKIKNYFYDQIIFNSMKISGLEYLKNKNDLSKQERLFCDKVENNISFRFEISDEIIKKKKDIIKKLSPINYVQNFDVSCSFNFIHSNNDFLISKEESINIFNKIKESNKNRLLITNLISRGDSNFKNIFEVPKLIKNFNNFFTNIGE